MAQFETITPTTELQAVNEMLAVIGEAPITQSTLDNPSLPDVTVAVDLLQSTMRAVLAEGWRFNTEWGYELAPTGDSPFTWTGTDGETEDLNIFAKPDDLLAWELTSSADQLDLDLVIRPPRDYNGSATKVFYDRADNRDGLPADDHDFLYINPVWAWDFEDSPQSFRTYATIRAGRALQVRKLGDTELHKLTQKDELEALRALRRDQGDDEDVNIFDNATTSRHLGRARRLRGGRFIDQRDSPRHN